MVDGLVSQIPHLLPWWSRGMPGVCVQVWFAAETLASGPWGLLARLGRPGSMRKEDSVPEIRILGGEN